MLQLALDMIASLERMLPASGFMHGGAAPSLGDLALAATHAFLTEMQLNLSGCPKVSALVNGACRIVGHAAWLLSAFGNVAQPRGEAAYFHRGALPPCRRTRRTTPDASCRRRTTSLLATKLCLPQRSNRWDEIGMLSTNTGTVNSTGTGTGTGGG